MRAPQQMKSQFPGRVFLVGLGGLLFVAPMWAVVNVQFVSPSPDQAVFGSIVVEAKVTADEPIARVEFKINGGAAEVVKKAPYKVTVDVGEENVNREFLVIAYGISGASASARIETKPIRIDDEMNLRLEQLYVTVNRGSNRYLQLNQNDFRVYDNNSQQTLVTFGRGDLPFSAVLLLDASESMRGEMLEEAVSGARAFIGGMKDLDETMLALFSDHLLQVTPFTANQGELRTALDKANAKGGTAVNDFLYMALKLLDARKGRRVIVLLSDGSDVSSALRMEEIIRKARRSQALVYWIQLEGGKVHHSYSSAWRGHEANDKEYKGLHEVIEDTGGRILPIQKATEIEPAFRAILQELRDQYALGFYPTAQKADGSWHTIHVKLEDGGLKVRTALGYVDY
jgi:Ca-activated chloride channel family protein